MSDQQPTSSVAVVGAGIAGAACAAGLRRGGFEVTVFDKSRGVGGRMSTRRTSASMGGRDVALAIDHGAQYFGARQPRFVSVVAQAMAAGVVSPWRPRTHAEWPLPAQVDSFVPVPDMPALCRHLLGGLSVQLNQQVKSLVRERSGWRLHFADGSTAGPFDHVVLAMPPAQAAALLAGHHDDWADALAAMRMEPCWTLMAMTPDVDWPWDAALPAAGPLAWIVRTDRKPGRHAPPGMACWVAHATPAWSQQRLESPDPDAVRDELRQALQAAVSPGRPLQWLYCAAHRWRYAVPAQTRNDDAPAWWDAERGLGVCGDYLGSGDIEAAWRSGDELADTLSAWREDDEVAAQRIPRLAGAGR